MVVRALSLILVCALSTGCVLRGPSGVMREVRAATGDRYEREFGLTLGRVSLAVARMGLRIAGESDEEIDGFTLKGVKKVRIGIYRVEPTRRKSDRRAFDPRFLGPGWDRVVRVREPGEEVHVLIREREHGIRGMLVVVADEQELTIVRLHGRLERIFEEAMGLALEEAGGGEYRDEAREQWRTRDATGAGSSHRTS